MEELHDLIEQCEVEEGILPRTLQPLSSMPVLKRSTKKVNKVCLVDSSSSSEKSFSEVIILIYYICCHDKLNCIELNYIYVS